MIKQPFSSYRTNFLIEMRKKTPYKRGIKIISRWRASPPNWASSPSYEQPLRWTNRKLNKKDFGEIWKKHNPIKENKKTSLHNKPTQNILVMIETNISCQKRISYLKRFLSLFDLGFYCLGDLYGSRDFGMAVTLSSSTTFFINYNRWSCANLPTERA